MTLSLWWRWWWWVVVGGGGGAKSFSSQTQLRLCQVELWLGWGFDNISGNICPTLSNTKITDMICNIIQCLVLGTRTIFRSSYHNTIICIVFLIGLTFFPPQFFDPIFFGFKIFCWIQILLDQNLIKLNNFAFNFFNK